MGEFKDQNEELREDRNFEHDSHKKTKEGELRDGDGRIIPKADKSHLNTEGELSRENDGGAQGRNNMGDKSGR
jgi:hypothetical protein